MALSSTILRFQIELADVDRGVYESLGLRVAQHPSEDALRVVVRVLAMCGFYEPGLAFGRGLSTPEDPALMTLDPSGKTQRWIDVGAPSAERLHRARKHCDAVAVVTHKDRAALRRAWAGHKIHRAESIGVVRFDPRPIVSMAALLARQNDWVVTLHDGGWTVSVDERPHDLQPERQTVAWYRADAATGPSEDSA